MNYTDFSYTDLSDSDFSNTVIQDCLFIGTDFSNTYLGNNTDFRKNLSTSFF